MSGFISDINPSILGGGMPGSVPLGNNGKSPHVRLGSLLGGGAGPNGSSGMVGGSARGETRVILRQAFGNSRRDWGYNGLGNGTSPLNTPNPLCGHFRAAYSAGDVRTSLIGGGQAANPQFGHISNQVGGFGRIWNSVTHDGINTQGQATYVGNPRYVYDSSDFIRYKKIKAQGKVYNDKSFGGDIKQNQLSALARVRR
jgi:hypothetical protein